MDKNAIIGRVENGQTFRDVVSEMLKKVPGNVKVAQIRYYSADEALLGSTMMDNKTGCMVVFVEPVDVMPVGTIIVDLFWASGMVSRENILETRHR